VSALLHEQALFFSEMLAHQALGSIGNHYDEATRKWRDGNPGVLDGMVVQEEDVTRVPARRNLAILSQHYKRADDSPPESLPGTSSHTSGSIVLEGLDELNTHQRIEKDELYTRLKPVKCHFIDQVACLLHAMAERVAPFDVLVFALLLQALLEKMKQPAFEDEEGTGGLDAKKRKGNRHELIDSHDNMLMMSSALHNLFDGYRDKDERYLQIAIKVAPQQEAPAEAAPLVRPGDRHRVFLLIISRDDIIREHVIGHLAIDRYKLEGSDIKVWVEVKDPEVFAACVMWKYNYTVYRWVTKSICSKAAFEKYDHDCLSKFCGDELENYYEKGILAAQAACSASGSR
jgi:hypothetical protein